MENRDEFEGTDMEATLVADAVVAPETAEQTTRARASRRDFAALFGLMGGAVGASMLTGCAAPGGDVTPFGGGGDAGPGGDAGEFGSNEAALTGTSGYRWFTCIGTPATPLAASLRTVSGTTKGQMAFASGFWVEGDGGGGIFYWDTASAPDNVGLRVNPSATGANPTISAPGWVRVVPNGHLNVRWFGAKGDAVPAAGPVFWTGTDDTAAIQKAVTVAHTGPISGSVIYVPRGRYKVTKNIGAEPSTTPPLPAPVGLVVCGDGHEASVLVAGYSDGLGNDLRPVAGVGKIYGMLSFSGNSTDPARGCSVEDIGVIGPVDRVAFPSEFANSGTGSQKGVSFANSQDCTVRGVRVEGVRDEAIYAEESDGWHVLDSVVRRCLSNALNLNAKWVPVGYLDYQLSRGCVIRGNVVEDIGASAIQVGGDSFVITDNFARGWPGSPIGASIVVLDTGSRGILSHNVFTDFNTSSAGVDAVTVMGSDSVAETILEITDNVFQNILSDWDEPTAGAGIAFVAGYTLFAGTALVRGNVFHGCGRSPALVGGRAGRFVGVFAAASSARIAVEGNVFRNVGDKNLYQGVFVSSGVSAGSVCVGSNFCDGVPDPLVSASTAAALRFDGSRRVVTTTGLTTLGHHDELIIVNVNGPVQLQLPSVAAFSSGRRQLVIRNTSIQTGVTNLMTGDPIEGPASLSGISKGLTLEAVDLGGGTTRWFVVSAYS